MPYPEKEFCDQVIKLARLLKWKVAHFRPAMTKQGWRTPVQGDGKGFPDLLMLRDGLRVVAELKVGKNKLSPEQASWLDSFRAAGIQAFEWRPEDWPEIEAVLKGDPLPPPSASDPEAA